MTSRWRALLAVLALAVVSAGCLSGGPLTEGEEPTPTVTPASVPTDPAATNHTATGPTPTATDGTRTSIPEGWHAAANEPAPNKSIALENDWSEGVSIHLEVIRNATGETVHTGNYTLEPGADRRVYDTGRADPDGIEEFTFVVSARDQTERVSIETNACYGDAGSRLTEDGELTVYYAIC